jgi:ubiquinone/menaquinone biosynthesis C-methylase UbiE
MQRRTTGVTVVDKEVLIQRDYYKRTADEYDRMHVSGNDEHAFALTWLTAIIRFFEVRSVLDIGSGTGRALFAIKQADPALRTVGIEPSPDLRAQGYKKGLAREELIDGDAQALAFQNCSFDLVCAFGALHHIPKPNKAVREMLRVARQAIFISDGNNFGQGKMITKCLKQLINSVGLWPITTLLKTRGRGYTVTDGDGLAYSYSVFNDYDVISEHCQRIHLMNTMSAGPNLYRTAPHVALLGLKSKRPFGPDNSASH